MPFFTFTLDFSPFFLRFSSVFDFSQSYFHEFLILISTAFLLWNLLWEFTFMKIYSKRDGKKTRFMIEYICEPPVRHTGRLAAGGRTAREKTGGCRDGVF